MSISSIPDKYTLKINHLEVIYVLFYNFIAVFKVNIISIKNSTSIRLSKINIGSPISDSSKAIIHGIAVKTYISRKSIKKFQYFLKLESGFIIPVRLTLIATGFYNVFTLFCIIFTKLGR